MVVVIVGYDDCINDRDIGGFAWGIGEALRSCQVVWTTSLFENRIKEYSEATRKFDVVAGVAKPCCAQFGSNSTWEEIRASNSDRRT